MRSLFILAILTGVAIATNLIANDVVSDYAQVKELLGQFYRRSARRFGHDYDPSSISKAVTNLPNDGTEASVNRKIWDEVFENDIILTLPQAESLLAEKSSFTGRGKRQAQPTQSSFWKSLTIPYQFMVADASWQNLIRSALRHIEQNTCMRFSENGQGTDGLRYFRGSGCYSNVGRLGGRQQVSIGYGCELMGIVAHETLHALGLWHEQSRDDRDGFVSMNTDWIIRGTEGNFEKRSSLNSDNMGQPYDLGSVMHYGPKSFTTNWSYNTIVTRDKKFQQTIGQRDGISFKDAKMINLRYCQKVCPSKLNCANDGYTDPNSCGKCRCPTGYGGTYCERVLPTSCGSEIVASSSFQNLTSTPVYANTNCAWRIRSPAGERLEILVDYISFPCSDSCTSFVEIKTNTIKTSTGARLCCSVPSGSITTEGDEAVIILRGSPNLSNGYLGFVIRYRSYGAPTQTTTTSRSTTTTTSRRPTTTTTTTVAPTTTPYNRATTPQPYWTTTTYHRGASGAWGIWGAWSECNRKCGGCGTRQRIRGCYGGNGLCNGYSVQNEPCNSQACAVQRPARDGICQGRIVLPCDLVGKIEFGKQTRYGVPCPSSTTTYRPNVSRTAPAAWTRQSFYRHPVVRNRAWSRRNKREINATPMCEKKFTYQCPTSLLTINMNWKEGGAAAEPQIPVTSDNVEDNGCCQGYYLNRGQCYKY